MAEFPTYEQMAKDVADKALDEYLINGKTLREWIKIIAEQAPCEDAISRRAVLDIIDSYSDSQSNVGDVTQDCISDVIALPPVNPQEPKTEWIPCSERLPKEGQIVLVCQIYSRKEFEEGTEVTIAQYKRKHFTWYRYQKDWDKHTSIMTHGDICPGNEYVTAWMPLPEPYKESEGEE